MSLTPGPAIGRVESVEVGMGAVLKTLEEDE
jgi:hypothetical protein